MTRAIDIAERIAQTDADKARMRLEDVRDRTTWEAAPASCHQQALARIACAAAAPRPPRRRRLLRPADTWIRLADPDRSITRPDRAIFCAEPPDVDKTLEVIPAAVEDRRSSRSPRLPGVTRILEHEMCAAVHEMVDLRA